MDESKEKERVPYPHINLSQWDVDTNVISLIDRDFALLHTILPIGFEGNRVIMATCHFLDLDVVAEIERIIEAKIKLVSCRESDILIGIDQYLLPGEKREEKEEIGKPEKDTTEVEKIFLAEQKVYIEKAMHLINKEKASIEESKALFQQEKDLLEKRIKESTREGGIFGKRKKIFEEEKSSLEREREIFAKTMANFEKYRKEKEAQIEEERKLVEKKRKYYTEERKYYTEMKNALNEKEKALEEEKAQLKEERNKFKELMPKGLGDVQGIDDLKKKFDEERIRIEKDYIELEQERDKLLEENEVLRKEKIKLENKLSLKKGWIVAGESPAEEGTAEAKKQLEEKISQLEGDKNELSEKIKKLEDEKKGRLEEKKLAQSKKEEEEEIKRKKIGEILVSKKLITNEQLNKALENQQTEQDLLGQILIRSSTISEIDVIYALVEQLGFEYIDLREIEPDPKATALLPRHIGEKYKALPIRFKDDKLIMAMINPRDLFSIDDLQVITGYEIEPIISIKEDIEKGIQKYLVEILPKEEREKEKISEKPSAAEDTSIIERTDYLVKEAVKDGAIDIHLEKKEDSVRIRYKINGVYEEIFLYPIKPV